MRGLDLSGVCFDGADLQLAKMAECNLARASFRNSNLKGASLWHADLKGACLDGANLEGCDLDLANLDGCTFKNAKTRKTIFPKNRISREDIEQSVKNGKKVRVRTNLTDE
jgi:uncharacterized protein YjbI with pentapeptide repeats